MPRIARNVFAHVPHHLTQRGNRREEVFFSDKDREIYLDWLKNYSTKHGVEILAYCLMTNHVHLVVVPSTDESLQRVFKPLHMRYAQHINQQKGWRGHLWQGRYFSSPLDESYLWAAIRYVERNPVRAKIVRKAESYPWSSAAAHCGLKNDAILTIRKEWMSLFKQINNWSTWLAEEEQSKQLDTLRRHSQKGLPCGSEKFINRLEKIANTVLRYRPIGRPKKTEKG